MATTIPELTLGIRLLMARKASGKGQDEIAAALGVSRALVSMWERDKGPGPRLGQLRTIADVTDTDFAWLAGADSGRFLPSSWQPPLPLFEDEPVPPTVFAQSA